MATLFGNHPSFLLVVILIMLFSFSMGSPGLLGTVLEGNKADSSHAAASDAGDRTPIVKACSGTVTTTQAGITKTVTGNCPVGDSSSGTCPTMCKLTLTGNKDSSTIISTCGDSSLPNVCTAQITTTSVAITGKCVNAQCQFTYTAENKLAYNAISNPCK